MSAFRECKQVDLFIKRAPNGFIVESFGGNKFANTTLGVYNTIEQLQKGLEDIYYYSEEKEDET